MTANLAEICDSINDKIEAIMKIEAKAAEKTGPLKAEVKDLENTLQSLMDDAGLTSLKGAHSVAGITETIRAQIADFDTLAAFVLRKKVLYLFERRIATVAYRELKESMNGKPIPGLTEYKQRRLNVKRI